MIMVVLFGLLLVFLVVCNFILFMILWFGMCCLFDFLCGIDMLIWLFIFICVFGLGLFMGVLVIVFIDIGLFGKLFFEVLENIDNKQVEGVWVIGVNQFQWYCFGVILQIFLVFVFQVFYYLEFNMRLVIVIGVLGVGGIGLILVEIMKMFCDWENISYIIILIIVVVIIMDQILGWFCCKLIEGKQ